MTGGSGNAAAMISALQLRDSSSGLGKLGAFGVPSGLGQSVNIESNLSAHSRHDQLNKTRTDANQLLYSYHVGEEEARFDKVSRTVLGVEDNLRA